MLFLGIQMEATPVLLRGPIQEEPHIISVELWMLVGLLNHRFCLQIMS